MPTNPQPTNRQPTNPQPTGPNRSRSLHHVAYTTKDPEATYDFYTTTLGMELLRTENHLNGDGWFRHFFFDIGGGESIAFFAVHDVGESPDYKTEISTGLGLPVWANHIAFRVDNADEQNEMERRLKDAGHPVQRIDHGWCESIYSADPNGIMIEFCLTTDAELFGDQSPEEALRMLRLTPDEFGEADRKDGAVDVS